jgi:hypothetical protein
MYSPLQVFGKGVHAAVLGFLAFLARRARRQVQRHHADSAQLHLEVAALGVEFLVTVPANHLLRLVAAVDGDAAVSLLHGVFVVAMVAGRRKTLVRELVDLRLGLLYADDVRILGPQPFEEPLACSCPDTVRIQADYPEQTVPPCFVDTK